jgi:type II secretory pathway component GspD/PulD (secretin)
MLSLIFVPRVPVFAQEAEKQIIEYLEFREVDIKDVLRQLAKQYNLNIVFSELVKGLVTVQLNNVSVEQAMDSVITVNGFAYNKKENVYKVTTQEEASREGTQTRLFKLNNANAASLKETLSKIVSAEGKIEADVRSNSLLVTDSLASLNKFESLVPSLDEITPQVLIETKMIETSLTNSEKLGIDWQTTIKAVGAKRPTTFPFNNLGSNKRYYPDPEFTFETETEFVEDTSSWELNPNDDPGTVGDEFVHPFIPVTTSTVESSFDYAGKKV